MDGRPASAKLLDDSLALRAARALVDAQSEPALLLDASGVIVALNAAAARVHGAGRPEDALGLDAFATLPAELAASRRRQFDRAVATGDAQRFEDTRDGQPNRSTMLPVRDADGRVALIAVVTNEMTDGRLTAEALQSVEERYQELSDHMRQSQEERDKLIALVENSNEFIGLASFNGDVLYVNKTARALGGLEPGDPVAGLTIFDFAPVEFRQLIAEKVLPSVREHGHWTGEAGLVNARTGEVVPAEISVFTVPSRETGRPICLATVMRDVSERTRAAEAREHLEAQLRQSQKMESIGRLAGGVAHDFNNLLTSILGNVSLVLEEIDPNDPIHAPLTDVRQAGESAASLTRQLLAFSRKQVVEPRVVNLAALIANMERMLRRIIGEDVQLETRTSAALSSVTVDPAQVEQIVVNLSVNARDAMPHGGRLVIETCDTEVGEEDCLRQPDARPGRYVCLSVSDTGSGMTDEVKSHVFEPFFTTKAKGTGLGLATTYGAVTQNGGFIDVDSNVGRGTTVRIHLPAVAAEPEALGPVGHRESPRGAETILLVEDEDLVRELAQRILARLGYRVISQANGEAAIAAAERHPGVIHLLVTDVVMPGMNGRELADRLSATRADIKVLFSSGYTDDIVVRRHLVERGVAFISKPYSAQALAAKVRAVLDA